MSERALNDADETVTIKRLAQILGVAHSTVSRALNGHPAISEATKKRVEEAAARYGYVPSGAARMLRNARSGVIGLIIPDIRNSFYSTVAKAIADMAAESSWQMEVAATCRAGCDMRASAESSWQMVVATTDDQPEREREAVRSLMKARAESIIIAPTAEPSAETVKMLKRVYTLQLLRRHPSIRAPSITVDDRAGIGMATRHLLDLGHRRIGYIGRESNVSTGLARLRGFVECFDLPDDAQQRLVLVPRRAEYGASALRSLLARAKPPTAIVLGSPEFTSGVLEVADEDALRIPEDLSLVCYGDSVWNRFLHGGLTTVKLPEKEIANSCVEMLRKRLAASTDKTEESRPNDETSICFQPWLVIRHSSRKL
ncbi:MAG: LacI family transcriptional regulator [Candidatus Accumulibacter sp.]|nr:LacI family transcriptional regulator [Accumulibacter sp.]